MQVDYQFASVFEDARIVLRYVGPKWVTLPDGSSDFVYPEHCWHRKLQDRYQLHSVVAKIVQRGIRPRDWHQLLLEWPHISDEDPMAIAYTRDDRKGVDNVQTRTSIGKYLARHWPHVPDHIRRDWSEAYGNHKFALWDTREQIICGIELGPQSCMKSSYGNIPFSDEDNHNLCAWFGGDKDVEVAWDDHPYAVYAPEYGWRMAVRLDLGKPDIVLGRGLVNINGMHFVRTYKRGEYDHSNSGTDERLEAWLVSQGYTRHGEWANGLKLRKLAHPEARRAPFMVPYIDGGTQRVNDSTNCLRIDEDGDYQCANTNGEPDEKEDSIGECAECDTSVYDSDDRLWAGRYDDRLICSCCMRDYTEVRGASTSSRGYTYYHVHDDDVLEVDGTSYDKHNLPDCIHELHDGDFAHEDDCVWVESAGAYYLTDDTVYCDTDGEHYCDGSDDIVEIDAKWYRKDDENVVKCYDDEYRLKADCWESAAGAWHSNEYDPITLDAGAYSADELRGIADDNE